MNRPFHFTLLLTVPFITIFLSFPFLALGEDKALTAAEIRTLIANMDDAGHPAKDCGSTKENANPLCEMSKSYRNECIALKKEILSDGDDFVTPPTLKLNKYDQDEFDKYTGKCSGEYLNKILPQDERSAEITTDGNMRLYVINSFHNKEILYLIFGKSDGIHKIYPGVSIFSYIDEQKCQAHELQTVPETGPLLSGSPHSVEYSEVSVVRVAGQYFISAHHKLDTDEKGILSFIRIKKRYDGHGAVEYCNFQ